MKKGRFSLILASVLMLAGVCGLTIGVLGSLGILPGAFEAVLEKISFLFSITGGSNGTIEFSSLLLIISIIIFAFRQRKPYSMFLPIFLPIIYGTAAILYRLYNSIELPMSVPSVFNSDRMLLIATLLILEIALTLVLLMLTASLDSRWRKRRDILIKKLEKDGLLETKESREANKIRARQRKQNEYEMRKQAKADSRYEKQRAKAERAEQKKIRRIKKREERAYEREREKGERTIAKEEARLNEVARKALDKEREKAETEVRKLEKLSRREEKKRLKAEKLNEKKAEREAEETIEPAPEYPAGPANPNNPLEFPDFIDMPELKTFTSFSAKSSKAISYDHEEEEKKEEKEAKPSINPFYAVMDEISKEPEEEEKKDEPASIYSSDNVHFRSGGMLEASLEMMNAPQREVERPRTPIRGFDDDVRREEKPQMQSSIAPSGLSPDHPRYKLFESLQNAPSEPVHSEPIASNRKGFAPSNLSPEHPRYKMFQSLQNSSGEESVSHFPSRSFEPEVKSSAEDCRSTYVKAPEPIREAPRYAEPQRPQYQEPQRPQYQEPQRPQYQEPQRPQYQEPQKPSYQEPQFYDEPEMDIPPQENSLDMTAGIGGLLSNNAGYAAIMKRENQIYSAPPLSLLKDYPGLTGEIDENTRICGEIIVETYAQQRIQVELSNIIKGPTVTMYELKLAPGMLISKITSREQELNYALGGKHVRILAPVPGKQAVGIEVPNDRTSIVGFKDMIYSMRASEKAMSMKIPMILGKTITGEPIVIDVAKMPHMIVAGTTGSGKSVCINSFINTLIFQKGPRDVRLILVDPKVVELKLYNGIPHLLTPVITEAKKVVKALNFLVEEMERRYSMISACGVRNIEGYNQKLKDEKIAAERMPYIVLIMDEFADMMAVVGKDIETQIARLAAKARAAGIHLILATQRPSADVITGTIKSNLPARIAFAVSSGTNSRVILDEGGAENLLGKGDMLLLDPAFMGLRRIQGAFLSDPEVEAVAAYARKAGGEPDYLDEAIFEDFDDKKNDLDDNDEASQYLDEDSDEIIYEKAKEIVYERKSASASYLQRRLKIGYNRAARIIEMMEEQGIIGPAQGSKPREILKYE